MPQTARVHVIAKGRVQGVGFRWFVQATARRLGVGGWVRNLPDRTVEAVAEGDAAQLDAFCKALERGPPAAHVTELLKHDEPVEGLQGFETR